MAQCLHHNIDYDDRNVRVCADCGEILDIHQLVNTYSYGEGLHGAYLEGQFMQINGIQTANSASRQATIQKFHRHFKYVAEMLQLSDNLIEQARKLYEAALAKQITQARKSSHVAAVLLAIICMQEGLPYLLIDFANIFQVNISELSSTFLDFTEKLQLNIPLQRPEVFVERFCEQIYTDIQDGRYDVDLGELHSEPSKSFKMEQKLKFIKDVKQLVQVMQELGMHVQKKPQLIVGVAIYLILQNMGVYCCNYQICDYIFMSTAALEKAVKAVLENQYFKVTPVEQILAETDIKQAVKQYKVCRVVNKAKRSKITTADGENPDGYHTAQFMDARQFTYFENGYIYELPSACMGEPEAAKETNQSQDATSVAKERLLKEIDDEVGLYLSDERQASARAELFDKLYRDDMLYYIERRKLKKQQGLRKRRRFATLDASLQSVHQLPKETRAQLSEVLQGHSVAPDAPVNMHGDLQQQMNEQSDELYEQESHDDRQIFIV